MAWGSSSGGDDGGGDRSGAPGGDGDGSDGKPSEDRPKGPRKPWLPPGGREGGGGPGPAPAWPGLAAGSQRPRRLLARGQRALAMGGKKRAAPGPAAWRRPAGEVGPGQPPAGPYNRHDGYYPQPHRASMVPFPASLSFVAPWDEAGDL